LPAGWLYPFEVAVHLGHPCLHHRRRLRHRLQRGELSRDVDVEDAAGQDGAGLDVVEVAALRVLVEPPGRHARDGDEDREDDERPGDEPRRRGERNDRFLRRPALRQVRAPEPHPTPSCERRSSAASTVSSIGTTSSRWTIWNTRCVCGGGEAI